MSQEVLLGLDIGTTSIKALAITPTGRRVASYAQPVPTLHPQDGWSEQDPRVLAQTAVTVLSRITRTRPVRASHILGLGLTNQRETTLPVDATTGEPLSNAILWHDLRTLPLAASLGSGGWFRRLWRRGGMPLTNYPSATKMAWLLRHSRPVARAARRERLRMITVDSWVAYQLLGGVLGSAPFITDPSNASRTLLLDLSTGRYDPQALRHFGLRREFLAELRPSWGAELGNVPLPGPSSRGSIPLLSILGDQQASLLGLSTLLGGDAKLTLGTGAFLLARGESQGPPDRSGVLRTILWHPRGEVPEIGIEGSVGAAGSFIDWLGKGGLGIFESLGEIERLSARSRHGKEVFVPALCGLFAPHWEMTARGIWTGIDLSTRRADLARSALDGLAHTVADLVDAVEQGMGRTLSPLLVDGGLSHSGPLLQQIADHSGTVLRKSPEPDATVFGAALAAGLGIGALPRDVQAPLRRGSPRGRIIRPQVDHRERLRTRRAWRHALDQAFLLTKRHAGPGVVRHPDAVRSQTWISV